VFDRALKQGNLDNANWFATILGQQRVALSAVSHGNFITTIHSVFGFPNPVPDDINYIPPPHDAIGLIAAEPVEGFTDFPITVPPTAPVPVLATWSQSTFRVTVTFDQLLQAGFSNQANWDGVANDLPLHKDIAFAGPLTIFGATVSSVSSVGIMPVPPPGRISYDALPADVIGATGLPAAAFVDFPMGTVA